MQINRHNYEQFFLLYVDNELSAADRKAVDQFVQENPDLEMELVLLQDTVMQADDIVLDKKDWLYMKEGITAMQEELLLYADNELSDAGKKTVEALLAADKNARAEWDILKQTRLDPGDTVVFANKSSLYRKEAGKLVGMGWWRVAAAAVILGFVTWLGVSVIINNNTTTGTGQLANGKKAGTGQNVNTLPAEDTVTPTTGDNQTPARENIAANNPQKSQQVVTNNTQPAVKNLYPGSNGKENVTVQRNSKEKPGNNLPVPVNQRSLENINRSESNQTLIADVTPENNNSKRVSGNNDAVVKNNPKEYLNRTLVANNQMDPNATAMQVKNTQTANAANNASYLEIDDDKEKRTALGGFLRKAKRVLERTTNVKTGEGIKIAGFEIALK